METYATYKQYSDFGYTALTEDTAPVALYRASRAIDTLTYNRIVASGYDKLTVYQKNAVADVCCALADWQTQNADLLQSPLDGYNINGVSVNYANSAATVCNCNGITIPTMIYGMLISTGLCLGVAR